MESVPTTEMQAAMTVEDLTGTIEYRQLSPKMGFWLVTYLQHFLDFGTFDPLFATQAAYECKTDESARVLGYQLLAKPKVISTLNRFFGVAPEVAFMKAVEKAMYNRDLTTAQAQALTLYFKALGWSTAGIPNRNGYKPVADRKPTSSSTSILAQKKSDPTPVVRTSSYMDPNLI